MQKNYKKILYQSAIYLEIHFENAVYPRREVNFRLGTCLSGLSLPGNMGGLMMDLGVLHVSPRDVRRALTGWEPANIH